MNLQKVNECRQSGNIAHIDIKNGTHGPYGTLGVIIDDGYFKKGNNNQKGEWVDRSYFVEFKIGSAAIKNTDTLNVGDYVMIESKLIEEKWEDRNTGQPRSALKLEAKRIVIHMARSDIKDIQGRTRQNGQNNNQQASGQYQQRQPQNNNQGGYQQRSGGGQGYNDNHDNNPPQNPPRNHGGPNGGGYQQRQSRPNGNQPQGGYGNYPN